MASWSSAFVVALKILLVNIVWSIVGTIVIALGAAVMAPALQTIVASVLSSLEPGGTPFVPTVDYTSLFAGLALIIAGFVITLLGSIATFLKYSAEYYAREIVRVSLPPSPPRP